MTSRAPSRAFALTFDCVLEIATEWRSSLHRRAWQNEYFLRSYALEPLPFCRKCHAPGADPGAEPPLAACEAGVGCTTCHVVPDGIVGARAHAPVAASAAASVTAPVAVSVTASVTAPASASAPPQFARL